MPSYYILKEEEYSTEDCMLYIRDTYTEYNNHIEECEYSDLDNY